MTGDKNCMRMIGEFLGREERGAGPGKGEGPEKPRARNAVQGDTVRDALRGALIKR